MVLAELKWLLIHLSSWVEGKCIEDCGEELSSLYHAASTLSLAISVKLRGAKAKREKTQQISVEVMISMADDP